MFKKLKWLYSRRQYRKALHDITTIVRYLLPEISVEKSNELKISIDNFLEEYRIKFGEADGLYDFFKEEIYHLYLKEERKREYQRSIK